MNRQTRRTRAVPMSYLVASRRRAAAAMVNDTLLLSTRLNRIEKTSLSRLEIRDEPASKREEKGEGQAGPARARNIGLSRCDHGNRTVRGTKGEGR